jgi:nucleotide-binding universal stress UspA family protein
VGFTEVLHQRVDAEPRYALGGRTDAALLVVGPTGKGFLKGLHLGSTTEYLLHHPPVPVVVARTATPVRRVLACVDGSPHAEQAVSALARMPWRTHIDEVILLTVTDDATGAGKALGRARTLLGTFDGVVEVIEGGRRHADVILDTARDRAVDLVVAGTRGHSSVTEAIIGSTARAITRRFEHAVLLAHDGTRG